MDMPFFKTLRGPWKLVQRMVQDGKYGLCVCSKLSASAILNPETID